MIEYVPHNSRFAAGRVGPSSRAAVFLDRDGVINADVHYLRRVEDLRLLRGAGEAIASLNPRFYIVVVTNQSGIARGFLTEDDLLEIHEELVRMLETSGAVIDAIFACPHLPEAPLPAWAIECDCRKPKPGMFLRAAETWGLDLPSSYVVGDSRRDIVAGLAAGVRGILVGSGGEIGDRTAKDLWEAAQWIM